MDTLWNAKRVRTELVEVFAKLPLTAIYSPMDDVFKAPLDGYRILNEMDVLAASSRCLGRKSQDRIRLLSWARAKAAHESIADLCLQRSGQTGWSHSQFYKVRDSASAEVAACLNSERAARDAATDGTGAGGGDGQNTSATQASASA